MGRRYKLDFPDQEITLYFFYLPISSLYDHF